MLQTELETPWLRRALLLGCLMGGAVSLSGCGGIVDLDVTIFSRLNLEQSAQPGTVEIPGEDFEIPEDQRQHVFSQRTDVDLTEDLDANALNKVDRVILDRLDYRILENQLVADLKEVQIWIGPLDAESPRSPNVYKLGTIASVSAGTDVETTPLPLHSQGFQALTEYLKEGKFVLFIEGKVVLEEIGGDPSGSALIEIDVVGSIHGSP